MSDGDLTGGSALGPGLPGPGVPPQPWEGGDDAVAEGYEQVEGYEQDDGYLGAEGYEEAEGYGEVQAYGEVGDYPDGGVVPLGQAQGGGYEGAGPGPLPVYRRRRHPVLKAVAAVVVVLVVGGVLGVVHISHEVNPSGPLGPTVTVTLPAGASTERIADLLARAGVVHGPTVFALYVKIEGAGPLLAGTYHLPKNEPYSRVIAALENGPVPVVQHLVVPEGFTIRQMAAALGRLAEVGVRPQAFVSAAMGGQVRSQYEPAGTKSLEGLLFPATYPVRQGEAPADLVEYMVETFDDYASQLGLAAAAQRLHYSPYQIVIVASIVEREAKLRADRGPIASVIYNRLRLGMPIGAESTLLYGLGGPSGTVDITTPNPYNTLVNMGLPPTPIASPGIPSLEAAINPPHTSYLYWVEINPDGKMGYASTTAGFKQLQRECGAVHLC